MRIARHYYCEGHENKPLEILSFIGAWERADGDVHTDSYVSFKNAKTGEKSYNLLDIVSWEKHRAKCEAEGWYFYEAYGHGCQTDDVIVAVKTI